MLSPRKSQANARDARPTTQLALAVVTLGMASACGGGVECPVRSVRVGDRCIDVDAGVVDAMAPGDTADGDAPAPIDADRGSDADAGDAGDGARDAGPQPMLAIEPLVGILGEPRTYRATLTRNGFAGDVLIPAQELAVGVTIAEARIAAVTDAGAMSGADGGADDEIVLIEVTTEISAAPNPTIPVSVAVALARATTTVATTLEVRGRAFASDSTFSADGTVRLDLAPGVDEVQSIRLLADGRILIGGGGTDDPTDGAVAVVRDDGVPDPTFGTDGVAPLAPPLKLGTSARCLDALQAPSGELVLLLLAYSDLMAIEDGVVAMRSFSPSLQPTGPWATGVTLSPAYHRGELVPTPERLIILSHGPRAEGLGPIAAVAHHWTGGEDPGYAPWIDRGLAYDVYAAPDGTTTSLRSESGALQVRRRRPDGAIDLSFGGGSISFASYAPIEAGAVAPRSNGGAFIGVCPGDCRVVALSASGEIEPWGPGTSWGDARAIRLLTQPWDGALLIMLTHRAASATLERYGADGALTDRLPIPPLDITVAAFDPTRRRLLTAYPEGGATIVARTWL